MLALFVLACPPSSPEKKKAPPDPKTEATTHFRLAQSYLNAGKIHDAANEMKQAVTILPDNAEFWNFNGQILFLAGRYEEAEQAFRKALERDSYLTDARNNLGVLFDKTGRKSEAEEQFRKALTDPAYSTPEKTYLNLGLMYASEGRRDEAIRELRKSVEIAPKYFRAHYELASQLEATGKLEEAAREYEVAAPDYRTSGEYHYRLGFTYVRLGNKPKALEHLRRVQEVSTGSENAARADDLLKMVQ
jgi:type IV pilus biogenesis/stability protein PilW